MLTDRLAIAVSLSAVLLAAGTALAEAPVLEARVPDATVTVGDRVPVRVQGRGEAALLWGELAVSSPPGGPWAVVDGPNQVAGARPPAWELTLAPMATGSIPLPEMLVTVRSPDGDSSTVALAGAPSVEVASVLPPGEQVEPAPLREPIGVHGLPWEWLVPILIVLIPALALQHWWLRRRRGAPDEASVTAIPPAEELEALARELELAVGRQPEPVLCDRLAAGLRRYLERRTGEPAREMTSFELRAAARRLAWPEAVQRGIHRVMQVVDGVRFGRRGVADAELRQAITTAVDTARAIEDHLAPPAGELEAAS